MFGYIVRRVIAALMVLVTVSIAVFALFFYGPGDPALALCPENRCTPDRLERIRDSLGLERPVHEQYLEYMGGIFVGNDVQAGAISLECPAPCLGVSFKLRVPVTDYLLDRFPATVSVAVGAAVIFLIVGIAVGVFAARRRGTPADKGVVGASLIINAVPYYILALVSYLYLVSAWGVFPESGYYGPFEEGPIDWMKGLMLPWLILGLAYSTQYARFGRGSMIEALNEDFVRTAKAKGLSERRVTFKHGFRAAVVPIVTIFGLDFASLLAGTIFTERVFGVPGIGLAALDAIGTKDLPVIQATVLIAATFIVVANIVVDILYSVIDPRVRLS
jgi:peptide/nickel transport system permease protein